MALNASTAYYAPRNPEILQLPCGPAAAVSRCGSERQQSMSWHASCTFLGMRCKAGEKLRETCVLTPTQLQKHGRVVRPYIGIKMLQLNPGKAAQLRRADPRFPRVSSGILVPQVPSCLLVHDTNACGPGCPHTHSCIDSGSQLPSPTVRGMFCSVRWCRLLLHAPVRRCRRHRLPTGQGCARATSSWATRGRAGRPPRVASSARWASRCPL
jgi:hypothetical protein